MSEDSAAKHRAKQTVVNLTLSLLATLAIVLVIVLVVPRDDSNRIQPVDYKSISAAAKADSDKNILAPELPQGWWVNQAKWSGNPTDGVQTWKVGFVGPKNQYIGLVQAFAINPTWLAQQTVGMDRNDNTDNSNPTWSRWVPAPGTDADPTLWTLELENGDFVSLAGTASEEEFGLFAKMLEQLLDELKQDSK